MVQGALSSNRGPPGGGNINNQYSSNLEAEPDAFMEDDDNSDDDIGKPMKASLDYDSDEKNDEELMGGASTSQGHSELIDLGSSGTESTSSAPTQRRAAKIPKLSGPN
jgi:hypothetical protein